MEQTMGSPMNQQSNAVTVSERVINKVAAATDTDPTELEPLYNILDPDCLDSIFGSAHPKSAQAGGQVVFMMAGCEIVVRHDDTVEVTPINADEAGPDARSQSVEATEVSNTSD